MRSVLRRPTLPLAATLAWCLGFSPPPALGSEGTWTQKANLPMAVGGAAGAEIAGILYVAGGETAPYSSLNTLFAYDPGTDSWTRKADMPTARALPVASAINRILYVVGGGMANALDPTAAAEAYDPNTDTWTVKAAMPTARTDMAACAVDGLMYVIGGIIADGSYSSLVECYDPQTDQWTRKRNLLDVAPACAAQAVNGIIYVFTLKSTLAYDPKTDQWRRLATIPGGFESRNSVTGAVDGRIHLFGGLSPVSPYCGITLSVAYDPVQNRFADAPTMPGPCAVATSASAGGKIYVIGGTSGHPQYCPGVEYYDSLWVFDPHGVPAPPPGSWTLKADLPMAVAVAAGAEIDGILYVAGGDKGAFSEVNTLFAYDPKTDSWTRKQDMPTPHAAPVASAINGVLYVVGGGNVNTRVWTAATEAYDPKTDSWTSKAPMRTARGNMAACTVDGLLYVMGGLTAGNASSDAVECYDPETDQWTTKARVPETTEACAAETVNGIICLFTFESTFAYDPKTDAWTRKASIPGNFQSVNSMVGAVDGLIYLFGGLVPSDPICGTVYSLAYDPVQDRFTGRRRLPIPCAVAATATMGGRIFLAGGSSGYPPRCPGAVNYNSLWVFDPQGGVRPEILSFSREGNDAVRFVWQAEAGRLYAVESTSNPLNLNWARFTLATGNTVLATNRVVEATGTIPAAATARFFRVVEAD